MPLERDAGKILPPHNLDFLVCSFVWKSLFFKKIKKKFFWEISIF